jgi:tol-pal system protein YbgF
MARLPVCATIAFTLAATAGTPAAAAQEPGFLDRLFGGNERAAPAGHVRVAQASERDLFMRIDRLEAQIRQLTGAIEQLQHRNQQLEGQLQRMQEDTEYRFQQLGGKGAPRPAAHGRPQAAPQPVTPASPPAPGKRGDAFEPAKNPNAPGVPRPLGGGAPVAESETPPIGAPGGRDAGAPLDLAKLAPRAPGADQSAPPRQPNAPGAVSAAPPVAHTPKDEFDIAYSYMVRKDYAVAEKGLRAFLQKHPEDQLVPEASYWLGETLFQRQRYRDAAEVFLNVTTKYESAAKAPDALFRLGQSLAALGETEAACASLGEVMRKFPRAAAGVKHAVEREQKRVRC